VGYNNLVAANQDRDFVQAPPFIAMHCDWYSPPSVIDGLVLKDGVVGLNGPKLVPVILQHIPIGMTLAQQMTTQEEMRVRWKDTLHPGRQSDEGVINQLLLRDSSTRFVGDLLLDWKSSFRNLYREDLLISVDIPVKVPRSVVAPFARLGPPVPS